MRGKGCLAALGAAVCLAGPVVPGAHATSTALGWGVNNAGQLGDGSYTGPELCGTLSCSLTPVPVALPPGADPVAVEDAGGSGGIALLGNGTVLDWGSNESALGDGAMTRSSAVPVEVCAVGVAGPCPHGPYLEDVVAISGHEATHEALLADGMVVTWGKNEHGQLGNGTTTFSDVPVRVCAVNVSGSCPSGPYLEDVTAISGPMALVNEAESTHVVTWGLDMAGRLGRGTLNVKSTVPVMVCAAGTSGTCPSGPYLEGVAAISGATNDLALLDGGGVVAWGNSSDGGLGDGGTATLVPIQVCAVGHVGTCAGGPYLEGATAIAAGDDNHNLAVLTNGHVASWGESSGGQLGDGDTTGPETCFGAEPCSNDPVLVCALGNTGGCPAGPYLEEAVSAVAPAGGSLVLENGGAVVAFGNNTSAELGWGGPPLQSSVPRSVCAAETGGSCTSGPYLLDASSISSVDVDGYALVPQIAGGSHWYKHNTELTAGAAHVHVATKGTFKLIDPAAVTKCKLVDGEEIWNPTDGGSGEDLITAFTASSCKSVPHLCAGTQVTEVIAKDLPWPSHLVPGPPVRDVIEDVRLEVRCSINGYVDEYSGTLTPEVGNGLLGFAVGELDDQTDTTGNTATVEGTDKLKAPPGKITAH